MPKPLTRRQSEVVCFVRRYVAKRGYPPTIREVASELGIQPTAAAGHLAAVERKGVLKRSARAARGLTLIEGGRRHAETT